MSGRLLVFTVGGHNIGMEKYIWQQAEEKSVFTLKPLIWVSVSPKA